MLCTSARVALTFWPTHDAWDVDIVRGAVPTARRNTIRKPVT